ncbi:acyl-CoA dehydrogenase family protein [Streptomyces rapamycinicus]|uniref:Acyl-CoA dehydrogenase n=2 Tax=Streptomyces rapamycinicus TaxID=1226757 RepID=A0A0A0N671_STRRN|nr:acyl-CoA dehydrogenase family protein [Streptomyces rapamycinicus]AGP52491.1 acyl-CoA dehydrogenase [Streptomyces rapamycinicus NRRL 5491]MBB4779960.1 alkylation response protein AidB-like acyl-CoA dehydrogenase [Streptomyces rapamycinicus]RLV75385.1 acyl-CoA dehydrogenase [Streptomyces rapamycinicus NRRL 5491]UTP28669.1 acyl-CoA dehydrogenase family protein [Streptomyces rapamycinicus NRRL 5491]
MTQTLDAAKAAAAGRSASGAAFDRVLDVVERRRAEFDEKRHVPRDVIEEFKNAGIYRASTPKQFGGDALPPAEFLRLIERIAVVDGSAGWVASFGSSLIYLAALPSQTQAELYADGPDLVFAGGLFPVRPAERVPGGHRVSGRWKFASGCLGADVLGVGIKGGEAKGGRPLTAVLRPEQVEIVENWNVIGMRGTGSHDLVVDGAVVPDEWTFVRGGEPTVDEPLYRYPSVPYAAQVLAVVGLGVARAALDHVIAQGGRASYTGAPVPAERATYRIAVGQAEAQLRSARAYFYETTEEVWATVTAGDPASARQTSSLRLASAHLAKISFEVVRAAYQLGGIAAIADGNPMERYLRDASVVPQHAFLQEGMYDGAGAVLMGVQPFPGYL